MIVVGMPLKRDEVKIKIDNLTLDEITFVVEKEEGINLLVSSNCADENHASSILKKYLKDDLGPAFFFSVSVK